MNEKIVILFIMLFEMAELMLVGFISLALTAGEDLVSEICVPSKWLKIMLQCNDADTQKKISDLDYDKCGPVSTQDSTECL